MLKIQMSWLKGQSKLSMKKWPLVSLIRTTKAMGLIARQCIHYLVVLIPTLIGCNQETIVQEEGSVPSTASTSNRPASIAALNDASEGMNPHRRVHPMGATTTLFLTDFQMDRILRGLQALLPHRPLSLWSLQSAVTANEFGQYHLEVSLALTEEEGDQFLGELAGADRVEYSGMVALILVQNMMIMQRCKFSGSSRFCDRAGGPNITCFLSFLMV